MTRKQKNYVFSILVFSLNLIPLVAQGAPDGTATAKPKLPPAAALTQSTLPAVAPASGVAAAAAPAAAPAAKVPAPAVAKAPVLAVPASAAAAPATPLTAAPAPAAPGTPVTPPAIPVATLSAPVAPPAPQVERDLTIADLNNRDLIRDFGAIKDDVAEPNSSAILHGRIFADCDGHLAIHHLAQAPGCGSDAAFEVHVDSDFVNCMAAHKNDHCSDDPKSPNACVFLSHQYPEATFDLSSLKAVDIQLMHHNPDGAEGHENICEQFQGNGLTALHHTDQASITAKNASDAAVKKEQKANGQQAQIDAAKTQVKTCIHSEAELKAAYHACSMLALLDPEEYSSTGDCVSSEHVNQHEIEILVKSANKAGLDKDKLTEVANKIISWAGAHPAECKKAIAPLHTIAKRLATQKTKHVRKRDDDSDSDNDPLAGYDAADDVLQDAIDGPSCLDQDGKLSEMQENLLINRTEKLGEIKGQYSMEYRQAYSDLYSSVLQNRADNCGSWEMDTSCSAANRDLQSTMSLGQVVNAANAKAIQATAVECQMVMRSSNGGYVPPECQPGNMMGMNGLGPIGGSIGNVGGYGFGRF